MESSDLDDVADSIAGGGISTQSTLDEDSSVAPAEQGIHAEWFEVPETNESAQLEDLGAFREPPEEETHDYDSDNPDTTEGDIEPPESDDWEAIDKSSVPGGRVADNKVS